MTVVSQYKFNGNGFRFHTRKYHTDRDNIFGRYKNWLVMALRTAEVESGGISIDPADVIVHSASKMTACPPFKPLHPVILSVAALFTSEELDAIFGPSRRRKLDRLLGRDEVQVLNHKAAVEYSGSGEATFYSSP